MNKQEQIIKIRDNLLKDFDSRPTDQDKSILISGLISALGDMAASEGAYSDITNALLSLTLRMSPHSEYTMEIFKDIHKNKKNVSTSKTVLSLQVASVISILTAIVNQASDNYNDEAVLTAFVTTINNFAVHNYKTELLDLMFKSVLDKRNATKEFAENTTSNLISKISGK